MKKIKKILITGAGGTLGRAFIKRLRLRGFTLVGVDNSEWATAENCKLFPEIENRLGDFSETDLKGVDTIIHCAAYKHVDLGEKNPESFLRNNVYNFMDFILRLKKQKLLFISTDKAVNPISFYGVTKLTGETLTESIGGSIARLGNILGSNGSVIPIWEENIAKKEPITVTNFEMTRYVIEADDAVEQIWAQFLKDKKLIIPDMGKPITLMELLEKVLAKHSYNSLTEYKPGFDIIGLRPGEKMHEKLKWDHEKI